MLRSSFHKNFYSVASIHFTSIMSFVNGARGNNSRIELKYDDHSMIVMNNAKSNYGYCQQSRLVTEFAESTDRT